jgi:hypothetical protein
MTPKPMSLKPFQANNTTLKMAKMKLMEISKVDLGPQTRVGNHKMSVVKTWLLDVYQSPTKSDASAST